MTMTTFVTTDVVIRTGEGIALIRRRFPPYKACWAIPGGIVEDNETVEKAAVREAKEETGLSIGDLTLVGVYSRPDRDPRGRSISIVYAAGTVEGQPGSGSDAEDVSFFQPDDLPEELAFDHGQILRDYLSLGIRARPRKR